MGATPLESTRFNSVPFHVRQISEGLHTSDVAESVDADAGDGLTSPCWKPRRSERRSDLTSRPAASPIAATFRRTRWAEWDRITLSKS